MSKNVAVFVDVANLYYAARGQDVDVDYVALLKHATKGRDLIRAYAYSGLDPENENQRKFLDFLGKNGYRVVAKDIRKFGDGRVKANLDIELVVDLFRLADRMDVAVIVSGDGDFAPAIRALQDQGVRCEVISFKPNTSSDLFAVADEFVDAMKISAIGRAREAKGVGAPEMPAKEVNPDVGFREASPSVAAAALAAIRSDGGETSRGGRGRGRGTRRPTRATEKEEAPTPSDSASVAAEPGPAAVAGESAAETARRRRRRGGRGRGRRGRRGEGLETAAAAGDDLEPAEVTWQELDSLDELDGAGTPDLDQEVSFEEADAATLAELGLTAQPADVPSEEAPKAKPRARKPAAASRKSAAASREPAKTRAPAKPRASRAKPAAADEAAAVPTTAPAKRRAPRGKSAAAPADATDEGIWKRLTSARGTKRAAPEPPAES